MDSSHTHILPFLCAKEIKLLENWENCNVRNDVLLRDRIKMQTKGMTIQILDSSDISHGEVRDLLLYMWLPSCPGPSQISRGDHWWRHIKNALEACLL